MCKDFGLHFERPNYRKNPSRNSRYREELFSNIKGLTMHYNLLFSFCLFYVKLCLKMAYLKRTVKLQPGENLSQEDVDDIVLMSSKNMVTYNFY
jgi:hypothetical protein